MKCGCGRVEIHGDTVWCFSVSAGLHTTIACHFDGEWRLRPHMRAALERAGSADGKRDDDRNFHATDCECDYCVAFSRARLMQQHRVRAMSAYAAAVDDRYREAPRLCQRYCTATPGPMCPHCDRCEYFARLFARRVRT